MSEFLNNPNDEDDDVPDLINLSELPDEPYLDYLETIDNKEINEKELKYEEDLDYCEMIKDIKEEEESYNEFMKHLSKEGTKKCETILPEFLSNVGSINKDSFQTKLLQIIKEGDMEFTTKMGRPMTYLEMRSLYG